MYNVYKLSKCIWTSPKIVFSIAILNIFEIYVKYKKFQHVQFSFYSTPFVCFKTVFTFYVAPPQKVRAVGSFSPLFGGVNTHRPDKIINKNVSITLA